MLLKMEGKSDSDSNASTRQGEGDWNGRVALQPQAGVGRSFKMLYSRGDVRVHPE